VDSRLQPEVLRGKSFLEFSGSVELENAARKVLFSGEPFEMILKRYVKGTEQHFQIFATPLGVTPLGVTPLGVTPLGNIPIGEGQGVVIVLGDISRLMKLEQVRKDFAANVSHELRTPIQVVKGFAENIINSSLEDKDRILHFMEIIKKNIQTMENLTNDLLTLVSLEDNSATRPAMEETFLAPIIKEARSMVEIAARKKDISIETFCPPDLAAKLHGSLFIQALVNLLDNSIKYSGPGSRIRLYAYMDNRQIVGQQTVGQQLVIEVKDKGIGIPSEHMGRIFERFYRVDRSRLRTEGREEGGTGLGLAIVRHIAMLHNGTVEAESHAGEGSVFRLKIPV
jgi:two-component system phosphate regulon sensor histidine kinase PhoR